MAEPSEPEEREWFCACCRLVLDITSRHLDEDGCCAGCGSECCRMSELRASLAGHGLHLVTEADKAVLDACSAFPTELLRGIMHSTPKERVLASDLGWHWTQAELARRGEKA